MKTSLGQLTVDAARYSKKGRGGRRYPQEFRQQVLAALKLHGIRAVARATGLSPITIRAWVRKEPLEHEVLEVQGQEVAKFQHVGVLAEILPPQPDSIELISSKGVHLRFKADANLKLALAQLLLTRELSG